MANILIIDPEERIRIRLSRLLERAGHEVRFAPNGAAAERAVRNWTFDLALTALALPDTNGLKLLRQLTARVGWMRAIVFSTPNDPVLLRARDEGVLAVLTLPLAESEVREAVVQALAKPRPWGRHVA